MFQEEEAETHVTTYITLEECQLQSQNNAFIDLFSLYRVAHSNNCHVLPLLSSGDAIRHPSGCSTPWEAPRGAFNSDIYM